MSFQGLVSLYIVHITQMRNCFVNYGKAIIELATAQSVVLLECMKQSTGGTNTVIWALKKGFIMVFKYQNFTFSS